MLSTFPNLRFILMIGIGGGVPSRDHDIRLGDIVVSKPTGRYGGMVQYDMGKSMSSGEFRPTGMLNKPPQILLTCIAKLEATELKIQSATSRHCARRVGKEEL
ncbi:hypothetical protein N7493_011137 [Penicillium malachiteum]|uniref:Nucleoside phosphorylase domain-containing protein n=1 Tax=Penicillium malachiteum TaxID=1324776 RepID=A0AAD6MQV3_9EURO|nr:hypothetical protein N7493_011137 [Penicillium malachiteum]